MVSIRASEVSAAADLPDQERVAILRSERWIGYPRARDGVDRLEELFGWPPKQRMPNLLLVGPTNNGKSMLIQRFLRKHGPVEGRLGVKRPILAMQMPAIPTMGRFYAAALEALGAPFRPQARPAELEALAIRILRDTEVKILIIDEIHNNLAASTRARQEFLNVLRFLGNELRIPIVGVGTRDAYLVIRSDPQLENRFEPFVLPSWSLGDEFFGLLASFEAMMPLRRASNLANPATAQYLLTRCEGTIGELSTLLVAAAERAITTKEERISAAVLSETSYLGPRARRQLYERSRD